MTVKQVLMHYLASASPKGMALDDWKPIIRCAIAAWAGFLLVLIPASLKVLGQASFLVLVVSGANPPDGPVVKVLYDSFYNMLYICISWAIYVAASRSAVAARTHVYTQESLSLANSNGYLCSSTPSACFTAQIFAGTFIEGRSSLVYGVFLYIGCAFFLYLKFRLPSRLPSVIFGFVSLIVPVAYGPLFPYWYPALGQVIFVPMACQNAINIACAVLFWPRSMNYMYTKKIQGLLASMQKLTAMQRDALSSDPRDKEEWARLAEIKEQVRAVRSGLATFGPIEGYLIREFQYGRLGAEDLKSITTACRDVILKMGGFSLFYDLVTAHMDSWREKQDAGLASGFATPMRPSDDVGREYADREKPTPGTQTPSRDGTPPTDESDRETTAIHRTSDTQSQTDLANSSSRSSFEGGTRAEKSRHAHFKSKAPSRSFLHDALHHVYKPVGVFEMHDFTEREAKFPRQIEVDFLLRMMQLASGSTADLFATVLAALDANAIHLGQLNQDRFFNSLLFRRTSQTYTKELLEARDNLDAALEAFKKDGRLKMVEPYNSIAGHNYGSTPHRPLLRMFYLEFHLIRFASSTLKLTQKCVDLDRKARRPHWHYPRAIFIWEFSKTTNQAAPLKSEENYADEIETGTLLEEDDLYQTEIRDPDHGPPRHLYHLVGRGLVRVVEFFAQPSVFFALKAAMLISLVALPSQLRRTAGWFYHERGLWAIIMASFTQAPFTGDTVFTFTWRVIGTIVGVSLGCVVWYVGDGDGKGSPYGLGATLAVAFVILMYIRLRWVYKSPQPALILVITVSLIVGYSWQDTHLPSQVNFGVGWNVAWRRFVVVMIGISAAFFWSFFPKPTTGRQVIRQRLAAGAFEIGSIFVTVSNFARNSHRTAEDEETIRAMVVKANTKLLALNMRLDFSSYEPPIQGPWPKDKYKKIMSIQRELLDLMVSWCNNLTYMDPLWQDSMLRRTGWFDRELISDCLAVIFMTANSIKTGAALPQLVPSPLLDRFYNKMDLIQASQAEGSLPQTVTRETLEDPGYASFAVGSVITFSIVHRIDALLGVTKELVGEVWHTSHFIDRHDYQRMNVV